MHNKLVSEKLNSIDFMLMKDAHMLVNLHSVFHGDVISHHNKRARSVSSDEIQTRYLCLRLKKSEFQGMIEVKCFWFIDIMLSNITH